MIFLGPVFCLQRMPAPFFGFDMRPVDDIRISLTIVSLMWAIHIINMSLSVDLRIYGIHPRKLDSLWGILFMPFLHGNFTHLIANTSTLFILLTMSLFYSRRQTIKAVLMICLMGGGFVWLLGTKNSVHIGASGLIFGLIGFLMFLGMFRREWKTLFFSLAVCFFYGGALFSLLVYIPGISWAGHFFGFLSGVMAAWWMRSGKK